MQSKRQYLLRCVEAEVGSHRDHTSITLCPWSPVAGDVALIDFHWWDAQFHFFCVLLPPFILLLNDSELRRKWFQLLEGCCSDLRELQFNRGSKCSIQLQKKSAPKEINKNLTLVLISGRAGCEHPHIRAHWSWSLLMFCVSQSWLAQISL